MASPFFGAILIVLGPVIDEVSVAEEELLVFVRLQ
jgi:hypothetical protein